MDVRDPGLRVPPSPAMMLRARRTLLLLGLAASLAGCGSASQPPANSAAAGGTQSSAPGTAIPTAASGTAGVNPCGLVTKDQVAAAVGLPVADGKSDNQSGKPTCSWIAVDPNNATIAVISIDPSSASFDAAKQLNGQSGVQLRPVANLGQDAFYFGSGEGSLLEVKTGGGVMYVSATLRPSTSATPGQEDQAELVLAKAAVSHR